MTKEKYRFTFFGAMLWVSCCCLILALRFEPGLPFLCTMLGLGITVAASDRRGFPIWASVRMCFLAGLLLGPPFFVAGLFVKGMNWPGELGSAILAGAWAGSLLSGIGGLLTVSLYLLRHRSTRGESATTTSVANWFARLAIVVVYGLPIGLMAIHVWHAHAVERLVGGLEDSGLKAIPRYADSKYVSLPIWCDWWLSTVLNSRSRVSGIPNGYWVVAECPLSEQQSFAIQAVNREQKLTALNIDCHESSIDQLKYTVDELNQLRFDGVVILDFVNSRNTAHQIPILDHVGFSFGLNLEASDIDDDTFRRLSDVPNLACIDVARCEVSDIAKTDLAAARPELRITGTR